MVYAAPMSHQHLTALRDKGICRTHVAAISNKKAPLLRDSTYIKDILFYTSAVKYPLKTEQRDWKRQRSEAKLELKAVQALGQLVSVN